MVSYNCGYKRLEYNTDYRVELFSMFISLSVSCYRLKQKNDHDRGHLFPGQANAVTRSLNGFDQQIGHRIGANMVVTYTHFLKLKMPKKLEKH